MNKIVVMPIVGTWKGTHAISLSHGVVEYLSTEKGVHRVRVNSKIMTIYSPLYQLVQFDPNQEELDRFLPITCDKWRLAIKHVPKETNKYVVGLSDKGKLYTIHWNNYEWV